MTFNKYYSPLEPDEKLELAKRIGTSKAYLDQLSSGFRSPSKSLMQTIENATDKKVNILSWFESNDTQVA